MSHALEERLGSATQASAHQVSDNSSHNAESTSSAELAASRSQRSASTHTYQRLVPESVVELCDQSTQTYDFTLCEHSYASHEPLPKDMGTQWEDQTLADHQYHAPCLQVQPSGKTPSHAADHATETSPILASTPIKAPCSTVLTGHLEDGDTSVDVSDVPLDDHDTTFDPNDVSDAFSSGDDACGDEGDGEAVCGVQTGLHDDKKYLVFESSLSDLFRRCQLCGHLVIHV